MLSHMIGMQLTVLCRHFSSSHWARWLPRIVEADRQDRNHVRTVQSSSRGFDLPSALVGTGTLAVVGCSQGVLLSSRLKFGLTAKA